MTRSLSCSKLKLSSELAENPHSQRKRLSCHEYIEIIIVFDSFGFFISSKLTNVLANLYARNIACPYNYKLKKKYIYENLILSHYYSTNILLNILKYEIQKITFNNV